MTSQREADFREKMLKEIVENTTEIKAVKRDTERIILRLDSMNGSITEAEKGLSFIKGVSTFMFAALSVIVALLGVYK